MEMLTFASLGTAETSQILEKNIDVKLHFPRHFERAWDDLCTCDTEKDTKS